MTKLKNSKLILLPAVRFSQFLLWFCVKIKISDYILVGWKVQLSVDINYPTQLLKCCFWIFYVSSLLNTYFQAKRFLFSSFYVFQILFINFFYNPYLDTFSIKFLSLYLGSLKSQKNTPRKNSKISDNLKI